MIDNRIIKFNFSFIASVSAWCLLTIFFFQIKHIIPYSKIEQYFPLFELILDIPIAYCSWNVYKKYYSKKVPIFFIFLSSANLVLTDAGFYFVYYIMNFRDSSNIWNSIYMLPFFVFLLGQLVFWANIVKQNILQNSNRSYIISLFAILSLFAMAIFIMSTTWKENIFSYVGFYDVITAVLEFIIFDLAILSLVCSNNLGLSFISSGVIILIATNLWEKYIFSSGRWNDFNCSEIFWILGQIVLLFGLHYISINKSNFTFWTSSLKKIKSQISLWIFSLMNLSFLALFFAGYFSGLISKNSLMSLPFLMMIYALVIVLISNYIGSRFEKPFNKLKNNIDTLTNASNITESTISNNFLTDEFIFLQRFIIDAFKNIHEKNKEKLILLDIALRAAHDIRSPIAAMELNLKIIENNVSKNNIDMFKIAIQSTRDIANNLLDHVRINKKDGIIDAHSHNNDQHNQFILLHSLIEQVVSQKRHEWVKKSFNLTFDSSSDAKTIWVNVIPSEIKRMISNLLNNAIEACNTSAAIHLQLDKIDSYLQLNIVDNGIGIATKMIPDYLDGKSSKHSGEGLGLSNAKRYMENINGKLNITSEPNKRTVVTLNFPIDIIPQWHPNKIILENIDNVLILDDDISIQSLWFHRLQIYPVKIYPFSSYFDATYWVKQNSEHLEKTLFLVDYELSDETENGLTFLTNYGLQDRSYLVTSHADESLIQNVVEKLNIKLISKLLISDIKIIL